MKDWNDYALILALHRSSTLRATAVAMGTTHTTVARRLALLEKQYSASIFERIPGGYRATPFGEQLVVTAMQVEKVISDSERLYCASNEKLAGSITLSLGEPMSQFLLAKELGEFTRLYPSINLKVKFLIVRIAIQIVIILSILANMSKRCSIIERVSEA